MRVIALLPRPCLDVESVVAELFRRRWFNFCVCLAASDDDRRAYRRSAQERAIDALVVYARSWTAGDAARVIETDLRCNDANAVAVLIFDGPECPGYVDGKRSEWNEELGRCCRQLVPDVQVFEYSSSWRQSPPRIR